MAQASLLDGLTLDLFPLTQDLRRASIIGIGKRNITDALIVAVVIVMLDEGGDNLDEYGYTNICPIVDLR